MIIACRLVACGSSVYVQKKSSCLSLEDACSFDGGAAFEPAAVCCGREAVEVETEVGILANVYGCGVRGKVCVLSYSRTSASCRR